MAYTTSTLVTNWIGAAYDSTNDLTAANVTTLIAQADGLVDANAQPRYYPFNAVDSTKTDGTDTYVAPKIIQQASTHMACGMALLQLRAKAQNSIISDQADYHINQGTFYLNQLRDPEFALPVQTYRNLTLTFGTDAEDWDLGEDEAFVHPTALDSGDPANILEDTVRIGTGATASILNARSGVEFVVTWHAGYGKYVFRALSADLYAAGVTVKLTFDWTYQRDRGRNNTLSGVFLSG